MLKMVSQNILSFFLSFWSIAVLEVVSFKLCVYPDAVEANGILFVVLRPLEDYICHLTRKYLAKPMSKLSKPEAFFRCQSEARLSARSI